MNMDCPSYTALSMYRLVDQHAKIDYSLQVILEEIATLKVCSSSVP